MVFCVVLVVFYDVFCDVCGGVGVELVFEVVCVFFLCVVCELLSVMCDGLSVRCV